MQQIQHEIMGARSAAWIVVAAIISLGAGAALSHVIEPGVRVKKIMLATNTPALRVFPATPGPHPIALLAHGNGGSKEMLFRFCEALAAAGFECCSVDLAGYGESPQPCSLTNIDLNFKEAFRALGAVDVFIGHSLGGGVGGWSVREAGFRPKLFIGVGAPVELGEHGPPLLLLGGLFEEFFRPAQLRARTISPWSEHILEAFDPVLVRAAVQAACASAGKPVPAAPTAWRWRFAGLELGIAGALVLMFRLPELHPRLARIRGFIGDCVLTTPLFRALSEQMPTAKVDVLVRWPGAKDLLQGSPYLNEIFCERNTLGKLRLLWRLRRTHYDISINAYPQSKIEYRVIAWFINAYKRLSHRYDNYSRLDNKLITLTIEQDYEIHCVQNSLNLLKLLNLQSPDEPIAPEIVLSASDEQWAESFANQHQFAGKLLLGLHVGSGTTKNLVLKRWPVSHYVQLIQNLIAVDLIVTVLLFGGPEEKEANAEILKAVESTRVIMVPSRTIKQATAVLKKCDVFLSVDNLFMHLAAVVKVPQQIVIESPTFNKTVEPYHRPYRLVRNRMVAGRNLQYYRFDGRNVQGTTEHLLECMRSISPEAVFGELQQALAERRTGVQSRAN